MSSLLQTNKIMLNLKGYKLIPITQSTRGEMDITTVFGTVIGGSNPSGCTREEKSNFLDFSDTCAGRSHVLLPSKTASRGRENSERRRGIICDHKI